MTNRYAGRLLISSVAMILCGLCHWVWKYVMSLTNLFGKLQSIGNEGFVYSSAGSWLQLLRSGSQAGAAHRATLYIIVPLQIICGIVGILFSAARFAKRDFGNFNIIPFVFGFMMCLVGAASLVLLLVSSAAALPAKICLCVTLAAVPAAFAVCSVNFYKG